MPTTNNTAITVTDPRNDTSAGRVSTTYTVTFGKQSSVRRKYSDFQWLQTRLAAEVPGAIVPIIPHKYALDKKFEPDFIEQRRHSLQRFLQNVMNHPELNNNTNGNAATAADMSALHVFLTIPLGDDFDSAKRLSESSTTTSVAVASSPTSSSSDQGAYVETGVVEEPSAAKVATKGISSFFSKAMTLTQVTAGSVELAETEGEAQITAITAYITKVEGHVTKIFKSAQAIVKLTADESAQFDEVGVPIGGWRTTYQNNTDTAAATANNTTTTNSSSSSDDHTLESMSAIVQFTTEYSELLDHRHSKETSKFLELLECLQLDLKAFQAALNQRYDFRVHYTAKLKKVKDRDMALSKQQRGKDPESVSKAVEKMQTELHESQRKADLSKRRLEECTQRILRESERMRMYFEGSLKKAIMSYGKLQMEYNKKVNEAWMKLMPHLE